MVVPRSMLSDQLLDVPKATNVRGGHANRDLFTSRRIYVADFDIFEMPAYKVIR
jgi:hypothetical protein